MPPTVTFSLIQELVHRDGVRIALSGRDDVLLEPVLQLLIKHLSDPRFGTTVCNLAGIVIGAPKVLSSWNFANIPVEMYSSVLGQSPVIDGLFLRLKKKLTAELKFQKEVVKLKGAVDMLMSASALRQIS